MLCSVVAQISLNEDESRLEISTKITRAPLQSMKIPLASHWDVLKKETFCRRQKSLPTSGRWWNFPLLENGLRYFACFLFRQIHLNMFLGENRFICREKTSFRLSLKVKWETKILIAIDIQRDIWIFWYPRPTGGEPKQVTDVDMKRETEPRELRIKVEVV